MTLQLIGYWQEDFFDDYPLPQEVEGELPGEFRQKLVRYLNGGSLFEQYRGLSWCRYGCEDPNGSKELTDGVWVWPEGLAHYVEKHGITLPPEFLAHVDAHTPASPSRPVVVERDPPPDESLWIRWAAQHRSADYSRALADARSKAESILEEAAAALAKEHGLGDETCFTPGCGRPVMRETEQCPRCWAKTDPGAVEAMGSLIPPAPWTIAAPRSR